MLVPEFFPDKCYNKWAAKFDYTHPQKMMAAILNMMTPDTDSELSNSDNESE